MRRGAAARKAVATPARILLADADAFYVAVARMIDPDGAGREPLLVVGGHPGGRGVVCSASYEARRFGVRSAMSIALAQRLCPGAMFVPVPRGDCSRKSREIAGILERFAPVVEGASIDEWYLDMSGTEAMYHHEPLEVTAHLIRHAVHEATRLHVSFGGGSNRLVAKLAVEVAKPRPGSGATGVHVVPPGEEALFMERFSLGDLPGVGPRFRERLERMGFRTIPDVLPLSLEELARRLGEREGGWLYDRIRGIGSAEVTAHEQQKGMSREETFGRDVNDEDELDRELLRLVTRLGSDLRGDGLAAGTISVKLRDGDFRTRRASRTLDLPVIADRVMFETARELLARLRQTRRVPVRLLGVALTALTNEMAPRQMALFPSDDQGVESPRDRKIAETLDRVRQRFGQDAVVPARLTGAGARPRRPRP